MTFHGPVGLPDVNSRNLVKLTSFIGVPAQNIELRFVETTLFCPWFFVAGDYNAFSLIRNNSNTALNSVLVTWYGLNGTVAGSTPWSAFRRTAPWC